MRDKFAKLDRPSATTVLRLAGFICLLCLALAYTWSGSTTAPASGIVQSAGSFSGGRISGGTQQTALVRVSSGALVPAFVAPSLMVVPGDNVQMLKQSRLFGGPTYQIVSKKPEP
jgi:hypothetical protein